ncbi:MAG: M48 family metalloprotease [Oscillatoria sp. SIO1A7]|nr:M48 family metalloprotease [Oscillatoria sp. SIO1A7]
MNQIKTLVLLSLLSALLVTLSYWLIGGVGGAMTGIALAAVTNLGSWYFSDRIALAAYGAREVSYGQAPELYEMVERLCDRAPMPMPKVYVIPTGAANAFATGRDPQHAAVAVTEGIMQILPEEELEAVIAHELSHINNRDTLTQAVAATIASAISFLAQMAFWFSPGRRSDNGANFFGILLTYLLAPVAATVIQLGISRTREFSADAGAAKLTGNPRALARALQRLDNSARQMPIDGNPAFAPLLIMNPLSGGLLKNLFSTHPATEDRIQQLMKLEEQLPGSSF